MCIRDRLIRSYAELIEGKLAGKQGNLDQAIKTFSAVMDNKSYPEKIRDMGRLALAKAEIAREKSNPEQAEEGLSKYPQSLPVQILSLNNITVLLAKKRLQDAERLISKYPGSSPDLVFQQGALAFLKKDLSLIHI